jgi:hypothetical protein
VTAHEKPLWRRPRTHMVAFLLAVALASIAFQLVRARQAELRADSTRADTNCVAARIGLPCNSLP